METPFCAGLIGEEKLIFVNNILLISSHQLRSTKADARFDSEAVMIRATIVIWFGLMLYRVFGKKNKI
jgi:hypothetical protein